MGGELVRYQSSDEDSGRWVGFELRPGDIVISTRSKSGTTWMQMICALLVFRTPELPAPLWELSPWLDWLIEPRDEVVRRLEAQPHRRFIKTHTPLDGVPFDPRVTYIVVGRHPLDMAVSLYHHKDNLDRDRLRTLTGRENRRAATDSRLPLREWLLAWIESRATPREALDSLPGVMWHVSGAWRRRREPNIVLVHHDDLSENLEREMRHLAQRLGIAVPEGRWPALVEAASFDSMRARSDETAPDPAGILKSTSTFFRGGRRGEAREVLTAADLERYHQRAAELGAADMLDWLHHGGLQTSSSDRQ